jgi:hypothetical protein
MRKVIIRRPGVLLTAAMVLALEADRWASR